MFANLQINWFIWHDIRQQSAFIVDLFKWERRYNTGIRCPDADKTGNGGRNAIGSYGRRNGIGFHARSVNDDGEGKAASYGQLFFFGLFVVNLPSWYNFHDDVSANGMVESIAHFR